MNFTHLSRNEFQPPRVVATANRLVWRSGERLFHKFMEQGESLRLLIAWSGVPPSIARPVSKDRAARPFPAEANPKTFRFCADGQISQFVDFAPLPEPS